MSSLKRKEVTFRHWFNRKFGEVALDETDRANYVLPTNIANFDKMFKRDFPTYEVSFNSVKKYANNLETEVRNSGSYELPRSMENIDFDVIAPDDSEIQARIEHEEIEAPEPFEYKTFQMDEMEDNPPKLHRTNTVIDRIDSTYTDEGGQYGESVTIITGESGSGKTTVEIDRLTKYLKVNPNIKVLYLSTELARGDLRFVKMTLPQIGKIPVLLLMDYIMEDSANNNRTNNAMKAVEHAFNFGYDILVLDSYQDLVGKMADSQGMRPTEAQRWLIEKMIDSATNKGTAVRAIQHSTKSGTYVGSTLLKHTTTAMFELKFDQHGRRYAYYSKNRRGGAMQHKALYFDIDKEKNEIVYDEEKFNQVVNADSIAKKEQEERDASQQIFDDIMKKNQERAEAGEDSDDAQELNTAPSSRYGDDIADPLNEPELIFTDEDNDTEVTISNISEDELKKASEALNSIAEEVEFEDVD